MCIRDSYVIAHGIASEIEGRQVCIGSHHFIFEDESCRVLPEDREKFQQLPADCSLLYLAIGGVLAAAICIEDPLRPEAPAVIAALKELGIAKTVMTVSYTHLMWKSWIPPAPVIM